MKENPEEKAFIASAKSFLNAEAQNLDHQTLSRLREARYRSIHAEKARISWLWPATGMAVACAGILAFFLFLQTPEKKEMIAELEDIELLASSETIEFYDDLEFYGWLAESEGTG